MSRKRPSGERDRRIKKAPAGPAKHAAKKLPERRAMIAARRQRIGSLFSTLAKRPARWSRGIDRRINRGLERADPALVRAARRSRALGGRMAGAVGPRLRPLGVVLFRGIARGE